MIGIPFDIVRESERGAETNRVYLLSRRNGEVGQRMRFNIRSYRNLMLKKSMLVAQVGSLIGGNGAKIMQAEGEAQQKLLEEVNRLSAAVNEITIEAMACAAEIAMTALAGNYADKAADLIDTLTDAELDAIVSTVELGQMPADFSQSLATRRMQSGTGAGGSSQPTLSPEPAGAGTTGSKVE